MVVTLRVASQLMGRAEAEGQQTVASPLLGSAWTPPCLLSQTRCLMWTNAGFAAEQGVQIQACLASGPGWPGVSCLICLGFRFLTFKMHVTNSHPRVKEEV